MCTGMVHVCQRQHTVHVGRRIVTHTQHSTIEYHSVQYIVHVPLMYTVSQVQGYTTKLSIHISSLKLVGVPPSPPTLSPVNMCEVGTTEGFADNEYDYNAVSIHTKG